MHNRHHFAFALRQAMCFPEPPVGPPLDSFLNDNDAAFFLLHMEAVRHNRAWLTGQLFAQKRFDEAVCMLQATEAATERIAIVQASLVHLKPTHGSET